MLDAGADPNISNQPETIPLMLAIEQKKMAIACMLLERGAFPLNQNQINDLDDAQKTVAQELQTEIIPQRRAALSEFSERFKEELAEQSGVAPYLEYLVHEFADTPIEQRPGAIQRLKTY